MTVKSIESPTGIKKYLPILQWLPGYSSKLLRLDLIAGLTTAASIWSIAAIGIAAGSGLYLMASVAGAVTAVILAIPKINQ